MYTDGVGYGSGSDFESVRDVIEFSEPFACDEAKVLMVLRVLFARYPDRKRSADAFDRFLNESRFPARVMASALKWLTRFNSEQISGLSADAFDYKSCAEPVLAILMRKCGHPDTLRSYEYDYNSDKLLKCRDALAAGHTFDRVSGMLLPARAPAAQVSALTPGTPPSNKPVLGRSRSEGSGLLARNPAHALAMPAPPMPRSNDVARAALPLTPLTPGDASVASPYSIDRARAVRLGSPSVPSVDVTESSPLKPRVLQTSFSSVSIEQPQQPRGCLAAIFRYFCGTSSEDRGLDAPLNSGVKR